MDRDVLEMIREDLREIKTDIKSISDGLKYQDARLSKLELEYGWVKRGLILMLGTVAAVISAWVSKYFGLK